MRMEVIIHMMKVRPDSLKVGMEVNFWQVNFD